MDNETEWIIDDEIYDDSTSFQLENSIAEIEPFLRNPTKRLNIHEHISFVLNSLQKPFPFSAIGLDTSRPWLIYWSLNILTMCSYHIPEAIKKISIDTLFNECLIESEGAFGGSSSCFTAHILTTYAALCSLALIGNCDEWYKINVLKTANWLKLLFSPDKGTFAVHIENGESDLRATYAAISVIHLLGLEKAVFTSENIEVVRSAIISAQTFEGGLGAVSWSSAEAHGGYTYCGIAALHIIDRWGFSLSTKDSLDVALLKTWIKARQCPQVGGLNGRTGKLVDSCYSFWVGSLPFLLKTNAGELFNVGTIKNYLLSACQAPKGGMRDKPSKY